MNKKIYIAAIGTALAFTSAFAITAFAEQDHDQERDMPSSSRQDEREKTRSPLQPFENLLKKVEQFNVRDFSFNSRQLQTDAPATVTINPHGETRLTNAKVTALSGDIVSVEIWKLSFSVHSMPDTQVLAGNKKQLTFSQIAVGDMVDVLGQLDATTAAFIHAKVVHDRTQINQTSEQEKSRLQALINELISRLNALLTSRGQAPLPTPSGSPSPSASPSPSSGPSPSPSSSPSPSPSSSPSPSPSPSSSPSPSPSASPSPSSSPSPSPSTTPR